MIASNLFILTYERVHWLTNSAHSYPRPRSSNCGEQDISLSRKIKAAEAILGAYDIDHRSFVSLSTIDTVETNTSPSLKLSSLDIEITEIGTASCRLSSSSGVSKSLELKAANSLS